MSEVQTIVAVRDPISGRTRTDGQARLDVDGGSFFQRMCNAPVPSSFPFCGGEFHFSSAVHWHSGCATVRELPESVTSICRDFLFGYPAVPCSILEPMQTSSFERSSSHLMRSHISKWFLSCLDLPCRLAFRVFPDPLSLAVSAIVG